MMRNKKNRQQKYKVFISTSSFGEYSQEPLATLEKAGLEVRLNPLNRKLKIQETIQFIKEVDFLIAGTEDLSRDVLRRASRLKIISRCGVGLDNVDLKAAQDLGIKVLNTSAAPTHAVAELTVGLMLDLLRQISSMDRAIRSGLWQKKMGALLKNTKIGIIGYGQIGKEVGRLCHALGAEFCFYDPALKRVESNENVCLDLPQLLRQSDIVTLHVSYAKENHHLIGKKELSIMKKSAFLINCARGGLVDEEALYRAIKKGHIAGAALDVFENEPYQGPLIECDNVILTPHIGSYAREARIKMEVDSANNLVDAMRKI